MNAPLWFSNLVFWGAHAALLMAIACHELIHVRRSDWAQHLAEEVIRTCLWFHPAIAWLIARVRLAREVVVLTNVRKTYLKATLEFTA